MRVTCHEPDVEHCWDIVHSIAAALDARPTRRHHRHHPDLRRAARRVRLLRQPTTTPSGDSAVATRRLTADRREARPRQFEIPVVYGGEFGPDLDEVAGTSAVAEPR